MINTNDKVRPGATSRLLTSAAVYDFHTDIHDDGRVLRCNKILHYAEIAFSTLHLATVVVHLTWQDTESIPIISTLYRYSALAVELFSLYARQKMATARSIRHIRPDDFRDALHTPTYAVGSLHDLHTCGLQYHNFHIHGIADPRIGCSQYLLADNASHPGELQLDWYHHVNNLRPAGDGTRRSQEISPGFPFGPLAKHGSVIDHHERGMGGGVCHTPGGGSKMEAGAGFQLRVPRVR
nr:hypothetical protein CFP56_21773 [Quercus suber]